MHIPQSKHSSVNEHLVCFLLWLLKIMLLWTWMYNIYSSLYFQFFRIYPDMELLDHIVILCLIFLITTIQFFTGAAPFYIPTCNVRVPVSTHLHQHLLFSGVFFGQNIGVFKEKRRRNSLLFVCLYRSS